MTGVSKSLQPWHENCPAPVETTMLQIGWLEIPRAVPPTVMVPAVDHEDGLAGVTWYVFSNWK